MPLYLCMIFFWTSPKHTHNQQLKTPSHYILPYLWSIVCIEILQVASHHQTLIHTRVLQNKIKIVLHPFVNEHKINFLTWRVKEQHIIFQDWALNDKHFLTSWKGMFVHSLAKFYIIETFNNKPMFILWLQSNFCITHPTLSTL
jgi:hypothetical protein